MLLFLALKSYVVDDNVIRHNGKRVNVTRNSVLLSSTDNWYLVHFLESPSDSFLNEASITLDIDDQIEYNWYKLYLTPEQIQIIRSNPQIRFHELSPEEKYINTETTLDKTRNFIAKVLPGYQPKYGNYEVLAPNLLQVKTIDNNETIYNFTHDPKVYSISAIPSFNYHLSWAAGFIQQNVDSKTTTRVMNNRGFTGSNQVITVMDTGLDVNNCFFYDTNVPFKYDVYNTKHRKIVLYESFVDSQDKDSGHGTHVSGIVAGKSNGNLENYNGVAYDAKLHFIDIGKEGASSLTLYPVTKINEQMERVGSHISSCSWGIDGNNDDIRYYWDMVAGYSERLFVFSAGNKGDKGYGTIGTPSNSKNILAVGNLEGPNAEAKLLNGKRIRLSEAGFGGVATKKIKENIKILHSDENYCSKLETTHANAAIIVSKEPIKPCTTQHVTIPVYVSKDNLDENITIKPNALIVHATSSRGPSRWGVAKPDVLGPGTDIYSAKAHSGQTSPCSSASITSMSGTSMAAPAVSGAAALLREYLLKGYYPSGQANAADSFDPDSSTMRALLIASCDPWTLPPSMDSGFGPVNLANIMTFKNNIKIAQKISASGETHWTYKIKILDNPDGTPLRVVLAYLDRYGVNGRTPLYADIDIFLEKPDGTIIAGNQHPDNHEEHFSTIERIYLNNNQIERGAEYTIHVIVGGNIDIFSNKIATYSLVAVGPIDTNVEFAPAKYDKKEMECDEKHAGVFCQVETVEFDENVTYFTVYPNAIKYLYINFNTDRLENMTLQVRKNPEHTGHAMLIQFRNDGYKRLPKDYPSYVETSADGTNIIFKSNYVTRKKSLNIFLHNRSPHQFTVDFRAFLEEYSGNIPPPMRTPTASPVATIAPEIIIAISTGYVLFVIAFSGFIAMVILYRRNIKRLYAHVREEEVEP